MILSLIPPGSAIYIRDDDLGVFWSPTPLPIREQDAYRVRHGQGYSIFEHNSHAIEQELLIVVPVDSAGGLPVRLERLRLRNLSSHLRKLTITSYAGLVLGPDPEETRMHVATRWDLESQSLFARNPYELGILRPYDLCHLESAASFTSRAIARRFSGEIVPCAIPRR